MKILYIITLSSWGGAQKYVYNIAVNLAKIETIEFAVAGGQESIGELSAKLLDKNLKFIPIKRLVRRISPLNDLLAVWEIKKLIDKEKPDVVHLNSSKAGAVGSLAAKLSRQRPKVIYTVHGWVFKESLNPIVKLAYFLIEKVFAGFKDYFICLSDLDRQIGINSKITPINKVATIYNGLDLPDNYFFDKETALSKLNIQPNGRLVIGTIANFYATKGLPYLIEAVKILNDDYKLPILAVIIGEGELRPELERQITDLKLQDKIILTGSINDASKYLKAFDIAVMSSVKEGLPYFILEAMSAGLPIVATKVGGIPEIVSDDENGFLIESKNPIALAEKIKVLAEDINLRNQFGNNNQRKSKTEFNSKTTIEKTIRIYK
jgi:glycosyltransferase involved in cell wall biosynthesis